MVRDAGFEPAGISCVYAGSKGTHSQIHSQSLGDSPELGEIVTVWPDLPQPLKAAILAIVRSSHASDDKSLNKRKTVRQGQSRNQEVVNQ
jgi:hypothetical protein